MSNTYGSLLKSLRVSRSSSNASLLWFPSRTSRRHYAKATSSSPSSSGSATAKEAELDQEDPFVSSGISRPLSEILKQLNKKVPDSLVKVRLEDGFSSKYVPWHIVNRIMNLHAPEWSGEIRSISYSPDGKSVSVVYRVTLYGTDAEIFRESTGTATLDDTSYGDPIQKAEAMAFRRACARFGLGLHLYHEDML
ncbi:cobalt ion binding protein [Trema orientale]|uniref:Cobalt ion binding protein n=1 Tax=Trema orientale TaxID=63057 RepID=A0A2P5FBH1_TREOI|nr:cobalt ion binding protein [Trema orientale]